MRFINRPILFSVITIALFVTTFLGCSKPPKGGMQFCVQINVAEIERQLREENRDLPEDQIKTQLSTAVKRAQEQAVEVIRNRVVALGVARPVVSPEMDNRIVVQLPGLKEADRERAARLIQMTGFLEFAMVHDDNARLVKSLFEKGLAPEGFKIVNMGENRGDYYQRDEQAVPDSRIDAEFRDRLEKFQAPPGYRFLLEEKKLDGRKLYLPYFVKRRYEMKGDSISSARVEFDQLGRPYVALTFGKSGARKFAMITADYAPGGAKNPSPEGRKYLAIILDGRLYSAPFIKTAIPNGQAIIEGNFSLAEAQALAIVLQSGSLPAPVEILKTSSLE